MLFLNKIKYLLKNAKLTTYLVTEYKRRIREKKILSKNSNKEIFRNNGNFIKDKQKEKI